jgi:1-acyl-sn-glycerol-3-phosphate acyltransferase
MSRHARPSELLFGLWAWSAGAVCFLVIWLVVVLAPGVARRRWLARHAARGLLRIGGMRLAVTGLDRLPQGACVVVANHASYLDGLVLTAALPPDFSFVIKREVTSVPLLGLLLRRLRSQFVERFDRHGARADAADLLRRAERGHPIGIFPEGTFIPEPGVRRFKRGAFVTACRAGMPVAPVAIRGTRHALGGGSMCPRPGAIEVEVLTPLWPTGSGPNASAELRDAARRAVIAACGEPDLEA